MTAPVLSAVGETVNMGVLTIHLSSISEVHINTFRILRIIYGINNLLEMKHKNLFCLLYWKHKN